MCSVCSVWCVCVVCGVCVVCVCACGVWCVRVFFALLVCGVWCIWCLVSGVRTHITQKHSHHTKYEAYATYVRALFMWCVLGDFCGAFVIRAFRHTSHRNINTTQSMKLMRPTFEIYSCGVYWEISGARP